MANVNALSLTTPSDYGADLKAIERRRKYAELLQQSALQPMDLPQAPGVRASPLSGLAKMLQAYTASQGQQQADAQEKDVVRRYNDDYLRILRQGSELSSGTPAVDKPFDIASVGQDMPEEPSIPGLRTQTPAQAPNSQAAEALYMTHPETRQLGMQERQRRMMIEAFGLGSQGQPGAAPGASLGGTPPSSQSSGVPRDIALQLLLADASGKLLAEANARAHAESVKPVVARENAPVLERDASGQLRPSFYLPPIKEGMQPTFSPGGITGVQPIPGYNNVRAGTIRAEEGAKATQDLVPVPQSDGSTRTMPRSQAVQQLGRPPAEQAALDQARSQMQANPGAPVAVNVPPSQPIPSSAVLGQSQTPADRVRAEAQAKASVPPGRLPESAVQLQQKELDAIGIASTISADLAALKSQITSGSLNLGLYSNAANRGRNFIGNSSEQSKNFATFQATLERMRNDSLRLNSGVQTEGDSQRAWNELISNINDPGVVVQRLDDIQRINQRAAALRRANVDVIRQNFGAGPLDTSTQTQQPAAVGQRERRQPKAGDVVDGYRFKGGNPADRNSWERQ